MIHLDKEEQRFEDEIDQLVPVTGKKKAEIEAILARARKNRAISLRIAEYDLAGLKKRAEEEGMPYQTLISTILHKYVTDQLVDKREVYKTVSLAREAAVDFGILQSEETHPPVPADGKISE
ncbi:MAG: antitoxin [Spirochaetes bacterium]|nr:MAG: antitoxin [Spirochaetota bacterium]